MSIHCWNKRSLCVHEQMNVDTVRWADCPVLLVVRDDISALFFRTRNKHFLSFIHRQSNEFRFGHTHEIQFKHLMYIFRRKLWQWKWKDDTYSDFESKK